MKIKQATYAIALAAAIGGLAGATPAFAESTNSQTLQGWANETAVSHDGRISRDMYMNEMGRRWDSTTNHRGSRDAYMSELNATWHKADRDNRGLTPAEIDAMRGEDDSGRAGLRTSDTYAQPRNMGAANGEGQ